jgi:predicted dehydrogenase
MTFAMSDNNRFNGGLQRIKAMLDAGQIGQVRYARVFLTTAAQGPRGWRAHSEPSWYWALSAVGTHLIDLWRWYFGEPAGVRWGLTSPVYQSPNDEMSILVLDYPGRLLAELAVAADFRAGNRLELYGAGGASVADDVVGSRQGGSNTCKGESIPYQPTTAFVEEVADFVEAIQQRRETRATLDDGLHNVYIMEAARDGSLLRLL